MSAVSQIQFSDSQLAKLRASQQRIGSRSPTGKVLFIEDFTGPFGMANDGIQTMTVSRDWDNQFGDKPSCRLDTQGITTASTDPTSQPNTAGLVFKQRIAGLALSGGGLVADKIGFEMWLKFTTSSIVNGNGATIISMSLYSRDPVTGNFHGGRVWFYGGGTNLSLRYLDSTGPTWTEMFQYFVSGGGMNFGILPNGGMDRTGLWNYCKLIMDFNAQTYVSFQFNETIARLGSGRNDVFALNGKPMLNLASSGTNQAMHFSVELGCNTATRRAINIAQIVGTIE